MDAASTVRAVFNSLHALAPTYPIARVSRPLREPWTS